MKKRVISMLLCVVMLLSVCAMALTGCSKEEEEESSGTTSTSKDQPATLVMWCVTEEGTDDEQAQKVAKAMAEITKADFSANLIVKYFTEDEYFEKLEEALLWQQERKKAEEEDKKNPDKTDKEEPEEEPKEEEGDGELRDEDGNLIIDKTQYPELTEEEKEYQVDILYLSGYDRLLSYIEKDKDTGKESWLASLNSDLNGVGKNLSSSVPSTLLSAARVNGTTYAIPNNNVLGEYTYMLVDKQLYDDFYYTAMIDDVHSVVDLAYFLDDVATFRKDVLPINASVEDCMNLIAHYWDVDPKTGAIGKDFSILGYAYEATDRINRGDIILKFDNLMASKTYQNALINLMDFKFKGYFGEAAEGQKSAVSFVTGDASAASEYEDDYYVVVVDYPRATSEDIYGNMFAVSAYSSNVTKSMQVIMLLNTNAAFRNLFLYGIEGAQDNYTRDSDGFVIPTTTNKYHMDISKTGNEFLAYLPEGTDPEIWENAKMQNREALIDPLLGFNFKDMLTDDSLLLEDPTAKDRQKNYIIESINPTDLKSIADKSDEIWAQIQACKNIEELKKKFDPSNSSSFMNATESVGAIAKGMQFTIVEPKFDEMGEMIEDKDLIPTIDVTCELRKREIPQYDSEGNPQLDPETGEPVVKTEVYYVYKKQLTYYQLYYRWLDKYKFLPKTGA